MKRFLGVLLCLLAAPVLFASDHADPVVLFGKGPPVESLITDLFVFPKGDQVIVMLNVIRALKTGPPFKFGPWEYTINFDLHSRVTYENEEDNARYGGTIPQPELIGPDATIRLRLNDDTSLKSKNFTGLQNADDIRIYTGIRDDPFIFPRFFGTNVVAMVLSIPKSAFPSNQQDFLIWETAKQDGKKKQTDHVGRSMRTMAPRLDFLNKLPPREHVAAVQQMKKDPGLIPGFLARKFQPLLAIRQFDAVPDVMIWTTRRPTGYPNGRLLTDDVAKISCDFGECLLYELSFDTPGKWPRRTTNDKPFLDEFPYLAEPWVF